MQSLLRQQTIYFLLVAISAIGIFFLFALGLHGQLVLDDVGNLHALERVKTGGWKDAVSFLSGGVGPGGRPISLLSFLFQSGVWPNPVPLRLVNILLHCFNFLLVFFFVYQLVFRVWRPDKRQDFFYFGVVLLVALLWAVAPIQTNTVEYIIQRMTILSTTFVLIGMNAWVLLTWREGSKSDGHREIFRRVVWVTFSFGATLMAAVLSKESGTLLPVFIGVFVMFFGFSNQIRALERRWYLFLILAPVAAYFTYFHINSTYYFEKAYQTREFDVWTRLLTQPAVVLEYVQKIYFPWGRQFTLFNENYPVVDRFWDFNVIFPITIFLISLVLSWLLRKRNPLFGFGICFFFAGHLLESTALPLEMYFEHRNYLPSLGLWLAITFGLVGLGSSRRWNYATVTLMLVMATGYSAITVAEARSWEKPLFQAIRWYESNPNSHRAHGHLAMTLAKYGRTVEAANFYENSIASFPEDVSKPLLWLELECVENGGPQVDRKVLYRTAKNARYYHETINVVSSLVGKIEAGVCSPRVPSVLLNTLFILLGNPSYESRAVDLNIAIAKTFFAIGRYPDSREFLERAEAQGSRLDITIGKIQVDLAVGDIASAKNLLKDARSTCDLSFSKDCMKYARELEVMSKTLEASKSMDGRE